MENISRKKTVFALILAVMAVLGMAGAASAVPASDEVHILEQPNGVTFKAQQWGDEWQHGWETVDGYTILKNDNDYWVYAQKTPDGDLEPTESRVKIDYRPLNVQKHLRPDGDGRPASMSTQSVETMSAPSTGTVKFPVVMINFTDKQTRYTESDFQSLLFGQDPSIATGPGSLRDYYYEASYGQLTVTGDVVGWVTSNNTHDYYGGGCDPSLGKAPDLVEEAAKKVDSQVDFSKYDNDGNGYVDQIVVVHQGGGEEVTSNCGDIWSHHYRVNYQTNDGVTVREYTIQPETYGESNKGYPLNSIGVFVHELGHGFGLPDLYDTDYSSEGIGNWGIMAGGSYNYIDDSDGIPGDSPAHPVGWSKIDLGWISPTTLDDGQSKSGETLKNVEQNSDYYKLQNTTVNSTNYFMVENRQKIGFDQGLPGEGLLITHVDEQLLNDGCRGRNDCNDDESHKLVDVEAPDGNKDLDKKNNRGDKGDVWPGSTGKTKFGPSTTPDSSFYTGETSMIKVSSISFSSDTATADLRVGPASNSAPTAKYSYNPSSPDVNQQVDFDASTSSDSDGSINKYEWDWDNDGNYDSSGKTASHTFSSSGDKTVTLRVTDNDGATDKTSKTITVSSNTGPKPKFSYSPSSPDPGQQVDFDASTSSDPDGSINKYEWDWDNDGNYDSTGKTSSHTFSNSGDKTVVLRVTDDDGATNKTSKTISVSGGNSAPTAKFSYSPSNPNKGQQIDFDASTSSDPDGSINKYEWDWDNDGNYDSTGKTSSHTFSNSGDKTVVLRVTDDDGSTDKKTKTVSVSDNKAPTAKFSYSPSNPQTKQKVSFDATDSVDTDGLIQKYEWDFNNDGDFEASGYEVNHTFSKTGDYKVTLRVTDNDGSTDEKTKTVSVRDEANIVYSKPSVPKSFMNVSEEFKVTSKVKNKGGKTGEYNAKFRIDGETIDRESGKLKPGESRTLNITTSFNSTGEHNITIGGKTATVIVRYPPHENLSASIKPTTANAGGTAKIEVTVENTGTEPARTSPTASLSGIPQNWTIAQHQDDGSEFDKKEMSWVWGRIDPGKKKTVSITFNVPENKTGSYKINASVLESGNLVDSSTITVEVKDLTIIEVIKGDDDKIQFKDVQKAIQYWVSEETVPGTGKKVSFSKLQEIITLWATS